MAPRISRDRNHENSRRGGWGCGGGDRNARAATRLQDAKADRRGGGRRRPDRPHRGDLRVPWTQRRRQDDHAAHARHAVAAQRWQGHGRGLRFADSARPRPQADWLREPGRGLGLRGGRTLRAHIPRPAVWNDARGREPAGRCAHRDAGAGGMRRPDCQDVLGWAEAAPGHRARPGSRSQALVPGRTHDRARPSIARPCVGRSAAHARSRHDRVPDHALPRRSGCALRSDRDHRLRQDRGRRHTRGAQARRRG